jgi:hypothetical protein
MSTQLNTALENALNTENDFSTPINKLNNMNNVNKEQQQLLLQLQQEQLQLQQQLQQQQHNNQQHNNQQHSQEIPINYHMNFEQKLPLYQQQQLQQQQLQQQQLQRQNTPPLTPQLVPQNTALLNPYNQKLLSREDVLAQLDEINNSNILLPDSNKIKNNLFKYLIKNSYCEIIGSVLFLLLNSQLLISILSKYFNKFDNNENPLYSLILRTILFCVLFVLITRFIKNRFIH